MPTSTLVIREALPGEKPTAAFFTPYNITPGEGEKYILATAEVLIHSGLPSMVGNAREILLPPHYQNCWNFRA